MIALDIKDIPWSGRQLWDCDCAEKDGKYYLYFPLKDKNDISRLGAAVADSLEGPFVANPDPIRGSHTQSFLKSTDLTLPKISSAPSLAALSAYIQLV